MIQWRSYWRYQDDHIRHHTAVHAQTHKTTAAAAAAADASAFYFSFQRKTSSKTCDFNLQTKLIKSKSNTDERAQRVIEREHASSWRIKENFTICYYDAPATNNKHLKRASCTASVANRPPPPTITLCDDKDGDKLITKYCSPIDSFEIVGVVEELNFLESFRAHLAGDQVRMELEEWVQSGRACSRVQQQR